MTEKSTDELMWLIAESGNHAAVDEFIKRHPEHRAEMVKRMNLVHEMKGAKPAGLATGSFTPLKDVRELVRPGPRWDIIGGGFAIFVSAVFVGATIAQPPRTQPIPKADERVVTRPAAPDPRSIPGYDPNQNVVPPTPQPAPRPPAHSLPVTLEGEGMSLVVAINEISRQTNLNIEMGPGLNDRLVTLNFQSMPALTVLKELGKQAGFTVFEQTDSSVLLIPAVDPTQWTPPVESTELETERTDIPQSTETP